jgi:hypothetical protein
LYQLSSSQSVYFQKHQSFALVFNSAGYPSISYIDDTNYDLKYAYNDGTAWYTETVDSTGSVGRYSSLAFDNLDQPCISYYDVTNRHLKYAYNDGIWHTITVDSADNVGEFTSLAFDSAGYPCIAYYDDTNVNLNYAYSQPSIDPLPESDVGAGLVLG